MATKKKNNPQWEAEYNKTYKEKVMMLTDAYSDERNGLNNHLNRDEWRGYFEASLSNRALTPDETQTKKLFDKSKENNYLGEVIESYFNNLTLDWKFQIEEVVNFEDSQGIVVAKQPYLPYASPQGLIYSVLKYGATSPQLATQRQLLLLNPR
ncbi:MAG: hypothetical protein HC875_29335 [Anaerolineales bacterium]|nr:hypothetical protein [Anaerolineales bacterium]